MHPGVVDPRKREQDSKHQQPSGRGGHQIMHQPNPQVGVEKEHHQAHHHQNGHSEMGIGRSQMCRPLRRRGQHGQGGLRRFSVTHRGNQPFHPDRDKTPLSSKMGNSVRFPLARPLSLC